MKFVSKTIFISVITLYFIMKVGAQTKTELEGVIVNQIDPWYHIDPEYYANWGHLYTYYLFIASAFAVAVLTIFLVLFVVVFLFTLLAAACGFSLPGQ